MTRRALLIVLSALTVLLPGLVVAQAAAPTIDGSVTVSYNVPTRDAIIYLEVVHPTSHGRIVKAPAILTYSPYSVLGRNGDAAHWNHLGYARMYADVIGTGNSGGCYDYGGNREKRTAYDVVEWIAKQAWSTGKVGMLGASYDGTTQYAAAVMHPPHLAAIVPEAAIVRWWDYAFSGGLRYFDSNEQFGHEGPVAASDEGVDTPAGFDLGFAIPPPTDVTRPDWAQRVESTITPCDELKHLSHAYTTLPNDPAFWAERDYLRLLPTVKIPVLVAANWGDWNVKQANSWTAFHALTHSRAARLYMGTRWQGHGTPEGQGYLDAVDAWFARYLKGDTSADTVPLMTTDTADSAATIGYRSLGHASSLTLALGQQGSSWTLGPKTAGGSAAQISWTGAGTESGALEDLGANGQHLAFLSAPLSKSLRVFGPPKLRLRLTSPCDYVTLAVSLVDVDPSRTSNGVATDASQLVAVTRGWMDSRFPNDSYVLGRSLTPGAASWVDVPLKPTDYVFDKGHQLALVVQTDAAEWIFPRPCTAAAAPVVSIAYANGVSALTLPLNQPLT